MKNILICRTDLFLNLDIYEKLLFPFSFLLLSLGIQAEKPQWGIPDTISHYPIGPGAVYTHIEFTQKPIQLHQITLDLNNEYNAVEVYPSNGKTPDACTGDNVIAV